MANQQVGEYVENVSNGIDTYSIRQPLGVCAGICPFNFPAMIPLWMFPMAVTTGNTYILKPSEKDPGAAMLLAELALEAGLPPGVLNIVHGTHNVVNQICDHPDIRAVSFVGSDVAGMHIYSRASATGKRVQCNMGAKNHAVIMPDADPEATMNALVGAAFGAAGQRCMAISTAVFVGDSKRWEEGLREKGLKLKVTGGTEAGADLGPVISKQAKERICSLVESGAKAGARLVLDGRDIKVSNPTFFISRLRACCDDAILVSNYFRWLGFRIIESQFLRIGSTQAVILILKLHLSDYCCRNTKTSSVSC